MGITWHDFSEAFNLSVGGGEDKTWQRNWALEWDGSTVVGFKRLPQEGSSTSEAPSCSSSMAMAALLSALAFFNVSKSMRSARSSSASCSMFWLRCNSSLVWLRCNSSLVWLREYLEQALAVGSQLLGLADGDDR